MEQDNSGAQRDRRRRPASRPSGSRPQARRATGHAGSTRQAQGHPSRGSRPQARRAAQGAHRPANAHGSAQRQVRRPSQSADARRYSAASRNHANNRRKNGLPIPIPAIVGGVVVIGIVGWLLIGFFTRFDVTVNGEKVTMGRGSTIQTLLDQKIVTPNPGDLMAVDGSLLSKGDGAACTAVVDGKEVSIDTPLSAGNDIEITDGGDTTEEATEKIEPLPFEKSEGDRSFEAYWFGSIHLLSDGVDGEQLTRKGNVSGKSVSEVTKEPINAGYRIYTANPEEKVVALTFDDGPWPETTEEILDILKENDAKATFFTIGEQIDGFEDVVKRALKMGCKIYTHTWDHAAGSGGGTSIANMSASEQVQEVKKGYAAIKEATGEEPDHIMRAPGGNFYGDVIDNLWDLVDAEIGWDVDTEDWSRPGVDAIEEAILSVKSGQVILMHDGGGDRSQTVEALRDALPQLVKKGFKFVTVDELIAYGLPTKEAASIPTTKELDSEDEEETSEEDESTSDSEEYDSESETTDLESETEEA